MGKILLRGYVTFAEIALNQNISTKTLRKKVKHLLPFLKNGNTRKRLYAPSEWKFLLANIENTKLIKGI